MQKWQRAKVSNSYSKKKVLQPGLESFVIMFDWPFAINVCSCLVEIGRKHVCTQLGFTRRHKSLTVICEALVHGCCCPKFRTIHTMCDAVPFLCLPRCFQSSSHIMNSKFLRIWLYVIRISCIRNQQFGKIQTRLGRKILAVAGRGPETVCPTSHDLARGILGKRCSPLGVTLFLFCASCK